MSHPSYLSDPSDASCHPKSGIQRPASFPVPSRRRRGKIARLPADLRDELNARLEDGLPYSAIIDWLTVQGHPGINKQNLTNWKEGGYQDWRREQERIDNQAIRQEWLAEQIAKTQPSELLILIDHLFASQVMDALFGLDLTEFKNGLRSDPRRYIGLLNAYNRFKRQMMDIPTFQHFLRCQRQSQAGATVMTPDALRQLEIRLGLMPGHPGRIALFEDLVRQGQSKSVKVSQPQSKNIIHMIPILPIIPRAAAPELSAWPARPFR